MKRWPIFYLFLVMIVCLLSAQQALATEKEVSFKTRDGWTIRGTLSIPDNVKEKVPVVILLPSKAHDRAVFSTYTHPGQYQYPGLSPVITGRGVATLSLDLRGRGESVKTEAMEQDELSKARLDVQAALDFLESHPNLDPSRIGIIAEEDGAEAAVVGWNGDPRVRALALVSGRLSREAKEKIASSPNTPFLLTVSSEDKEGFGDTIDAFFLSKSKESDLEVYKGLGVGTAMFSVFRYKFPKEKPLHNQIGDWIADHLLSVGLLTEVSFQTQDGWTIYGNLRLPQTTAEKVPAVILLHSGLSDRNAYDELEVALAKAGMAVLNFDWRGKGKSTGKGKYFELPREVRDQGHLDALAALNFLASHPRVDANRTGIMGTVIGAKYAMAAFAEDRRIKTAIVLTGYVPTEKEKTYMASEKPPVFFITSTGHGFVTKALTEMYEQTKSGGSELAVYEGGAIGYQLFKLDKELMPRVVYWMKQKLGK